MAHLGFEGVLPPVEPVAEAAAHTDTLAGSMNDVSITQPAVPAAQPVGEAEEDFFNEGCHFLLKTDVGLAASNLRFGPWELPNNATT